MNDCREKCTCVIEEGRLTGWCQRHQCRKTAASIYLCHTRPDYFQLWEEGRGPGQERPPVPPQASGETGSPPPAGDAFPSVPAMAWNLAKSLAAFVADGLKTVDTEQYATRLKICDACDQRRGNRCVKCGCQLSLKARGRAFQCPVGKWGDPGAAQTSS